MKISLCHMKKGPVKNKLIPGVMTDCEEYYVLSVHEVEVSQCLLYVDPKKSCQALKAHEYQKKTGKQYKP